MTRTTWQVAAVVGLVSVLAACGSSGGSKSGGTSTTSRATNHLTKLARGETAGIASQLTPVPGYRYVDPPASEVKQALATLDKVEKQAGAPDFFSALSLHGVVAERADQNTAQTASGGSEVGLLALFQFSTAPPADLDQEQIAGIGTSGMSAAGSFTVGGVKVLVFERPDRPDSRWTYTWYRHGVQGSFDGATRPATERWVRKYLAQPEHEPYEDDVLAAQLVPVSGFAYTNWWTPEMNSALKVARGHGAASAHAIANGDGRIGTIILVDGSVSAETLATELADVTGSTAPPEATAISGVPVTTVTAPDGSIYTWTRDGVTGAYLGHDDAQDLAFLTPYLAAAPSASTTTSTP